MQGGEEKARCPDCEEEEGGDIYNQGHTGRKGREHLIQSKAKVPGCEGLTSEEQGFLCSSVCFAFVFLSVGREQLRKHPDTACAEQRRERKRHVWGM